MTTESSAGLAEWNRIQASLTAISTHREECEQFFGGVVQRLEEISTELTKRRKTWTANAEAHEKLKKLEQQQADDAKERAVLESQLETARKRVDELAESIAERDRQAAEQQQSWIDEMKQLRQTLKKLATGKKPNSR